MSHVDEGMLHAFLDGELSGVETERVRAHLDGCAACHARLDEERALIERANRLLERAAPIDTGRPIPTLEALAPRSGRRLPYVPLAWAATIALAIGLGWYLRGPGEPPVDAVAAGSPKASAPVATAAPPTAPASVAARTDQIRVAEGRGRLDAPATPQSAGVAETAPAMNGVAPSALASGSMVRQPTAAAAPVNPTISRDVAASKAAAATPAMSREAISSDGGAETWNEIPLDSARVLLGGAFATIPGLPIGSIQASAGPQAVVLLTLTPDSRTTIRLYERRAEADRQAAEFMTPARPSTQRLARYVGALRVEIAGTVGADSLSRLLESVR